MQATCAHAEVRPALFGYYVHHVTLLRNRASAWIPSKCHSFLVLPLFPIYIFLLHCTSLTPQRATPKGKSDLLPTRLTEDEITLNMLTFVRVGHYHSPLLMPLIFPTGQLGQHQHHTVVLPWSPPAVSRGITPGSRAGGPARVQSSRWVSAEDTSL